MSNGAVTTAAATPEEPLPWYAALVNHVLTPGSSLTTGVWNIFNFLIASLYLIWFLFLYAFPTSIHVWVFFGLLTGLALTTNWFMKEIFAAKEDFESLKQRKAQEEGAGDAAPDAKKAVMAKAEAKPAAPVKASGKKGKKDA